MDDFNVLARIGEIKTHYQTSDPVPINWLLNGRLGFLGDADMNVTFTSGTIESVLDQLTGNYDLIRFENGYSIYSIIFKIENWTLTVFNGVAQSDAILYDVELPTHFTNIPNVSVYYYRDEGALCATYSEINSSHPIDYLPTIRLISPRTNALTTTGYINIKMEGF